MAILVPDASIILKWVLEKENEPDLKKAIRILRDYLDERIRICLPNLWRYEVGNVLGQKQPKLAKELMKTLLCYEFDEEPLKEEYCLQILDLMIKLKAVSFYDASYHVLAIRKKGVYVTADRLYYRHAVNEGCIALLSDIKTEFGKTVS